MISKYMESGIQSFMNVSNSKCVPIILTANITPKNNLFIV